MDVGDYRILLVEGNINDAKIIKKYFLMHNKGIIVDYAGTADACYRKLLQHTYDLIVLEYDLPDGTGFNVLKELREIDIFSPTVMVASEKHSDKALEAVKNGASDFVTKTVEGYRKLPSLALRRIEEYQHRFLNSREFKEKRYELYDSKPVHELLKTIYIRNFRHIAPRTTVSYGFTTDLIPSFRFTPEKMKKILNILSHYRVLFKTSIGMKIGCPVCSSDNVSPVFDCPSCGSEIFEKRGKNGFICKGICKKRFQKPRSHYACNKCKTNFIEAEGVYEPQYIYSLNEDLKNEIESKVLLLDQLSLTMERRKMMNEAEKLKADSKKPVVVE
ncbi:MAG: response regulator [Candidatus Bathyarchaeota archaeon]|nr:response regulator [Candidatus Bathyarchaeota archaeon]